LRVRGKREATFRTTAVTRIAVERHIRVSYTTTILRQGGAHRQGRQGERREAYTKYAAATNTAAQRHEKFFSPAEDLRP